MTVTAAPVPRNRTLAALGAIVVYASVIGFTDNHVRMIAADAGLWQFHATRTAMTFALLAITAVPLGLRLRPVKPWAVIARSALHGLAMLVYFGSLAFLPVAIAAAGLFTAPVFVLLISRFVYGERIGPYRIVAVALGFAGMVLMLGLGGGQALHLAALPPLAAGALYAMGNIATRRWCEGESPEVLTAGFFGMLGLFGLIGMMILEVWQPVAPAGMEGFVLRGAVWPTDTFLLWTFIQAAGSLLGVGMMVWAYQVADASRVSIFEYLTLPMSALWTWILWDEMLDLRAIAGMALIVVAGLVIVLRGR